MPRLIGQTQQIADRKIKGDSAPVWTQKRLRARYAEIESPVLQKRLMTALDWSLAQGLFVANANKTPVLGFPGRGFPGRGFPGRGFPGRGRRIFTIYPEGAVYWVMNATNYLQGRPQRDELAAKLRALRLADASLDPDSVTSGRNLSRPIQEFSDEEFQEFLDVIAKVCEPASF